MSKKIVIIGGVAGGASAAARLRRNDEAAEIIVLERGGYISFANCGLPYYIGNTITQRDKLLLQTPQSMKSRFNMDVRVYHEVIGIDRNNKTLQVKQRVSGEEYTESYDQLVIATGASPALPDIPGIDAPHVFTLWTIPDADGLKAYVESKAIRHAVVLGGGFVGIEMAENLRQLQVEVSLVELQSQVMNPLDPEMAQIVHQAMNQHGVKLYLNTAASAIQPDKVKLSDGRSVAAELVIAAAGIRPNGKLAAEAGLELGPKGHIVVNDYLQTSDPDIYAVGDVIEVVDFNTGAKTAIPLAGPANKQGRIAADNICGARATYKGTMGTSVAKIFDLTVASTGSNEKSLLHNGAKPYSDYMAVYGHGPSHASYYPGGSELHTKLLFEPATGKLLGAQAIGREGADKRIDVLAACIRLGARVEDLQELELAYAPPYNTAKDPVNFLGYMAGNIMEGKVDIIQCAEVAAGLDFSRYQLVDVRTQEEYDAGTIPGSIHIPLHQMRERLNEMDPDKIVVVYCKAGLRSYIAARILMQHGFSQVKSMTGGWTTYQYVTYQPQ